MRWRRKRRKAEPDTTEDWVPDDWNDARERSFLRSLERAAQRTKARAPTDQPIEWRTR